MRRYPLTPTGVSLTALGWLLPTAASLTYQIRSTAAFFLNQEIPIVYKSKTFSMTLLASIAFLLFHWLEVVRIVVQISFLRMGLNPGIPLLGRAVGL